MKKYVMLLVCVLTFFSCKKKTTPTPTPTPTEENIAFDLNTGATVNHTASNFDFQVTLRSKMPTKGIKIDVTASEEATGTAVTPQPSAINSSTSVTNASVQNLPRQKWVITTVKVTSLSTATNSATQTFKVVYK